MVKGLQKKERMNKRLLTVIVFLLTLILLSPPLYILPYFSFTPLQVFVTNSLYNLLSLLGYQASADNFLLTVASGNKMMTILIDTDCTGWKSVYTLTALTAATLVTLKITLPKKYSKIRWKLRFLIIALPILFLLNIIRILTTIVVSFAFGFQYLNIVHTYLWREGLIFAVILLWYLWLRRENII